MSGEQLTLTALHTKIADVQDIPALEQVLFRVWPNWAETLQRPLEALIASPQETIVTAWADDRVCGCVVLSDGPPYSCLHALAVAPEMRRQGVAAALINEGILQHRKLGFTGLLGAFVLSGSPQARLFERAAFLAVPYDRAPRDHLFVVRSEPE